jgi:hypothetical protein
MSHFLDQRTEVTYGYGPLKISRYNDFIKAMFSNPALRKDLNVSRWLDRRTGDVNVLADPLPRANFPKELVRVATDGESKQRLTALDPVRQALVPAGVSIAAQDANGIADVREFTPGHYRIHFQCATPSLLRVSNAYFPGWAGKLGPQDLRVVPVDHALIGVLVPGGQGDVVLDYHSTYFVPAASVTLVTLLACLGLVFVSLREKRL